MSEKVENYTIYEEEDAGNVFIADHVVESIAGIAALEVEGVSTPYEMSRGRKLIEKGMGRVLPKKIKAVIDGMNVFITLYINIRYGYNVQKVCADVQTKVKNSIQNMTGMTVLEVNVHVVNIVAE